MMSEFSNKLSALLAATLIFIGIMLYSGKTAIGSLLLQSLSLVMLFNTISNKPLHKQIHVPLLVFLATGLVLVLVYTLPIPLASWSTLPGRSFYMEVIEWLQQQNVTPNVSISIIPGETMRAFLTLLPPLAMFLTIASLDEKRLQHLITFFFIIASIQAMLALIQYSSDNPAFLFGITSHDNSGQGTYLNRDHFAALMEMAIPPAIALMMFSFGRHRDKFEDSWVIAHQNLLYSLLTLLLFLGAIFSKSRGGIFLSLLAILISSITFARHLGGKQAVSITATLATIAIGAAISIGLAPVLNRFFVHDPLEDGRWEIFQHTIEGIKTFFPVGSGPGTFPDVYRAFQPIEQMKFINNAHNDYLELLFEMGMAGAFIIAFFLILYVYRWVKLWGQKWDRLHFLQVAAGISIFLLLLHSFVDFNLHTPANMIVFAFMCGIFFRKIEERNHRHRKRTSSRKDDALISS